MKRFYLILFFTTALLFAGAQPPLENTSWKLVSVDNLESGVSVLLEKKIVAKLQFLSEGQFAGSACEHHDGLYKAGADGSLRMKVVVGSKTPCMGVNYFELELLKHYEMATRFRMLEDKKLFIFCSDGYRLTYKKD